MLDVNCVPRPLMAEVRPVWSAETADETAVLSSWVLPEIDDCTALLMASLNVWVAELTAWL